MSTNDDLVRRADALYDERYLANAKVVDRIFAYLMLAQWAFAIIVAIEISPYTWEGKAHSIHLHVYLAVFLGGLISSLPVSFAFARPGWWVNRYVIAVAQMLWAALLIHLTGGRIETHFHIFGSLAFLAFYRDWRVLIPATIVVAADHLIRQMFWPESVYGLQNPEWWRFLEHAGWVVFEDVILVVACVASSREMRELARQQIAIQLHERQAAARMQTSILPSRVAVAGLEIAAGMRTADEVGGDYYDVVPVPGGAWLGIGDVAGHGTRAGLTMLQAQSALGALARHDPQASPIELWHSLNNTFVDTVRNRMQQDEHMTLSLLRYHFDGRFEVAGAHEEIAIWRERDQACEMLPVEGTWIGLSTKVTVPSEPQRFALTPGDVLVLYTDGITEAKDGHGGRVGIDRLRETIVANHGRPPIELRDAIMALAAADRSDDATVLIARYVGS